MAVNPSPYSWCPVCKNAIYIGDRVVSMDDVLYCGETCFERYLEQKRNYVVGPLYNDGSVDSE